MRDEKKIIVFAGPSGVGKSTLCHMVVHQYPEKFSFAVSATTRPMRLNEIPGKDYYFLKDKDFRKKIENNQFIEWEEVYPGRLYGTLKSELDRISSLGKKMFLDIDVLGALNIKKQFGDQALIVLVKPESIGALEKRLRSRKSDTEDEIQIRIARFDKELSYEDQFDSVVINKTGDLDGSWKQISVLLDQYFPEIIVADNVIEP